MKKITRIWGEDLKKLVNEPKILSDWSKFDKMNPIAAFIENDPSTMIVGAMLIMGVLVFAWFDYRRTARLPNLGTVMVKNRLNGSH